MPYYVAATSSLSIDRESVFDWNRAKPGQWFIGVIDTNLKEVKIAPVNVFDGFRGGVNFQVLNNNSPRAMNRYASGAPGERDGISIMPNYMRYRREGITHHVATCDYAGFDFRDSLGFTIIKINNSFAQMKSTSMSLNRNRPRARVHHSFSKMTHLNIKAFFPTGDVMPIAWEIAVVEFLKRKLEIPHICVSND